MAARNMRLTRRIASAGLGLPKWEQRAFHLFGSNLIHDDVGILIVVDVKISR